MANPIHHGDYFGTSSKFIFKLIKKPQIILHLKAK